MDRAADDCTVAPAWAHQQTGHPALQWPVCRQLIRRAEQVQAAPDIPALHEARRVLLADV